MLGNYSFQNGKRVGIGEEFKTSKMNVHALRRALVGSRWAGWPGIEHTKTAGLHAAAVPPPTVVQVSCPHNILFQSSAHVSGKKEKEEKSLAKGRPALRKGPLTSRLERASPRVP
eukprot:1160501-Pelagomonas_calceolata.AAC.13